MDANGVARQPELGEGEYRDALRGGLSGELQRPLGVELRLGHADVGYSGPDPRETLAVKREERHGLSIP